MLLKLHEVTQYDQFVAGLADAQTAIPIGKRQAGVHYGTTG